MKRLAVDVGDEGLFEAVSEWVQLLADERYQDAYDFLYHLWMPVLPNNELSADDIRDIVTNPSLNEPRSDSPVRVTPVETAQPQRRLPARTIHRNEVPIEHAWDSILVRHGGVPSGASLIGNIHFDIPLNGAWSDLTAVFDIVIYEGDTVLALENIHVL